MTAVPAAEDTLAVLAGDAQDTLSTFRFGQPWAVVAQFIAACSPETIAALRARVAELERDAERYRWLRDRCLAADFDYGERHECVLVFRWPATARIGQDLGRAIDAALASHADGER